MIEYVTWWVTSIFRPKHELAVEVVALRSQLALYQLRQEKDIIRDNDRIYGSGVPAFLRNSSIEEVRTAYHSPWQNPYCERITGTLRRELLDHIIPLNEQHLYRLLMEYVESYYHPVRTHSSLDRRPPLAGLPVEKPWLAPDAVLESKPILGGLYHNYRAKAA